MMQLRTYRTYSIRMMPSWISIHDGIRSYLERVRYLRRMSSKVLCKNRLHGSEQLQTVFAVYNQELHRDVKLSKIEENGEAKYWLIHQNAELQSSEWKNWDRSIGQESKRKMSVLKEKCETAFNNGRSSKKDSLSFIHGSHSDQRAQCPFPLREHRHTLMEEIESRASDSKSIKINRRESFRIERQKTV